MRHSLPQSFTHSASRAVALWLALLLPVVAQAGDTLRTVTEWRVEVDFRIGNLAAGIVFAGEDRENYFMWQVNVEGGKPRLRPHHWRGRTTNDARLLDEVPIDGLVDVRKDSTYHLRIDVQDSVATTYIDGICVDTRTNPYGDSFTYGPLAFREDRALRNYFDWEEASFDNLCVTNLATGETLLTATFDSEDDNPFSAGEVKDGWLHVEAAYAWHGKEKANTPEHRGWRMGWTLAAIVALLLIIALLLLLIYQRYIRLIALPQSTAHTLAIKATVVNLPKPIATLPPPTTQTEESAAPGDNPDAQFIEDFNRVVEENLGNPDLDINFLCDKLCLSRTSLYRRVKALYGMSANECIRKQRLAKAHAMLASPSCRHLTISAIAVSCGFNSVGYFRACFKSAYGCLPNEVLPR